MKNIIVIIIIIISIIFIIPYAVIKYIIDTYYKLFCSIFEFVVRHLNIESEMQNISILIDDNLFDK